MPNPELSQYKDHDTNTTYDLKDATARGSIIELNKYKYKILSVYVMNNGGRDPSDPTKFIFGLTTEVGDGYFNKDYDGGVIRCIFTPWPDALTYDPDKKIYFDSESSVFPVYTNAKQDTIMTWGEVNNFVMDFVFSKTDGLFMAVSAVASVNAANVSYNNSVSGLSAGNVQTVIDELASEKADSSALATVATSGDYDDLLNKPTIPSAQVNSDWNAVSGVAEILNKPSLATVATSGDYDDLLNKPTIPAAQVNSDWNANSGVAEILNKPSLATVATSGKASDVSYNNTGTSLTDSDVQSAISSLANNKADSSSLARVATTGESNDVSYNNGTSGLLSSNVKEAIDELALDLSGKQGTLTAGNNISISSGNVIDANARGIDVNGTTEINPNDATNLNLVAGSNMSITANGSDVTFDATDTKPSNGTYDSSPAAVPLASGSNWQCISNAPIFTAQAGQVWLFQIALEYQGNASGLRGIGLSGSSTTAPTVIFKQQVPAVTTTGTVTNLTLCSFVAPTSTTSYYIWGRQNSGSSLNVTYRYRAIRLL